MALKAWGYQIDSPLEWTLLCLVLIVCAVAYFYIVRFIRTYATGMVAGFILMLSGFGLVLGPVFYLISTETVTAERLVLGTGVMIGCITAIIGAFELTNFSDF